MKFCLSISSSPSSRPISLQRVHVLSIFPSTRMDESSKYHEGFPRKIPKDFGNSVSRELTTLLKRWERGAWISTPPQDFSNLIIKTCKIACKIDRGIKNLWRIIVCGSTRGRYKKIILSPCKVYPKRFDSDSRDGISLDKFKIKMRNLKILVKGGAVLRIQGKVILPPTNRPF